MPVDVSDRTHASPRVRTLEACAERLLDLVGRTTAELGVVVVGDEEMRALNRDHRGRDRATDVLSFSQLDDQPQPGEAPQILGDVVISVDTARRQAEAGGWTLDEELARLLVHGLLHLLGHDHEAGAEQEARMKGEETRLAAALVAAGIPCAREEPA